MNFIKSIIIMTAFSCSSYSAVLERNPSISISNGVNIELTQKNLQSFIGENGLLSEKYFQNDGEGCDFGYIHAMDAEAPEDIIAYISQEISSILGEINSTHTVTATGEDFQNIHFIRNGKRFNFRGVNKETFLNWQYLAQIYYKIFQRELKSF